METRNIKLSKQVSDFEQIVIIERSRFVKEREVYEKEILELTKKVADFQNTTVQERKKSTKEKKVIELEKVLVYERINYDKERQSF